MSFIKPKIIIFIKYIIIIFLEIFKKILIDKNMTIKTPVRNK